MSGCDGRRHEATDGWLILDLTEKIGQRLKALQQQGVTLDDLQEEYLEETKGTQTPEETTRRIARAEWERLEAEKAAKADAAATAERTKNEEQATIRVNAAITGLVEAFPALSDELDQIHAQGRDAYDVLKFWVGKHSDYPQDFPAALKAYEGHLVDQQKARAALKAPPPKPADPPPSGEFQKTDRVVPVARPRTAAITPDDAGEVPLRRVVQRKETAIERVQRLAAELDSN